MEGSDEKAFRPCLGPLSRLREGRWRMDEWQLRFSDLRSARCPHSQPNADRLYGGVGGEYAFLNWLTGFIEYDYYNFSNSNSSTLVCTTAVCGIATTSVGVTSNINVVKAGLNLKFGPF